jgi:type I restriction enzyme S subunit
LNSPLLELADVCSKVTDGTHKTPDYQQDGVRFISIKNIKPFQPIDWSAYERFISEDEHRELIRRCKPEYGDILFPRIGTLGYAKRIDFREEVSIFVGLGLAKPIRELVLPEYLEYWLNHPAIDKLSRERANGSGRLTLPLEESKKLPVPMAPLAEQARITERLDELLSDLDAGISELKAAQRKLAQYRQSLLKAAVDGTLTADWRAAQGKPKETGAELLQRILKERRARWEQKQLAKFAEQGKSPPKGWQAKYLEPAAPDFSKLPSPPDGWTWATVEQLAELASGHTPKDAGLFADRNGDVPWFKVGDMNTAGNEEKLLVSSVKFTKEHAKELGLKVVPADTIVFPKRGGAIATNKKRRLSASAAYDLNMMGLVSAPSAADWLWAWFQGVDLAKLSDGSNIPQINNPDIAPLTLPIPPASEQKEILEQLAQALDNASTQEEAIAKMLQQSAAQRKNLLKAAFSGQLVPQDPNDEPTSVLLARIRAERESGATTTAKKRGRKAKEKM